MVLDIILIIILAIGCFLGFKKGFFGAVTKPIKLIASICLTIVVASPIINAWSGPFFIGMVEPWVYDTLIQSYPDAGAEFSAESLPVVLKIAAELLKLDIPTEGAAGQTAVEAVLADISAKMAVPIGNFIAVVATYVALFLIFMILLTVLIKLLDTVFTKGWLGKVNKFFGMLLGAVVATVISSVLANIVNAVAPTVADGAVTQFFINFNPFSLIMQIR